MKVHVHTPSSITGKEGAGLSNASVSSKSGVLKVFLLLALLFTAQFGKSQFCLTPTSTVGLVPNNFVQTTSAYSSGAICFTFNATSGCGYFFATCGLSSADTYLRLYNGIGGTLLVSADDNCGAQSSFNWTCPSSGVYSILLSNFSCANLNSSTAMSYSSTCAAGLCSGTPNNGTAVISTTTGCPNATFNLNASGLTAASGLTYQWQSSASSTGPFTNLPSGTTVSFNTSTNTTTYYRMITTCTVSAQSGTTSVVGYSVVNPGPCVCNAYGAVNINYTGDEEIFNVVFGTLSNASNCTSTGPGPGSVLSLYSNYTGFLTAPNVCQGATVPFTVSVGTCGGWYGVSTAIYIDFNQNGSFTDSGELAYSNTTYSASATVYIGSVVIPTSAVSGTTRMRVITSEGSGSVPPSVGTIFSWGEAEDYCINILPMPTISASGGSVCPGAPFVSSPTGAVNYTFTSATSTINNVTTGTLTPIVNTTYTVSGTGSNGCRSFGANSANITVNVLASPILTVVATPTAYCIGGSAALSVSGASTYTWNTGSNLTSISVNPTTTTIYTVSGTGTNVCNGVNTVTVVVNPLPVISIAASAQTVCSTSPVSFTASGASTYTWNGTTVGATSSYSPANATTYTVAGTSTAGCLSSNTVAVATNTLPVVAITPPASTICAFYPLSLTASGAATYTWSNNQASSLVTVYQGTNTSYTVTGTSPQGCTSSTTIAVTTLTLPIIAITPSVTTACVNSAVNFTASGANSYTWSSAATGSTAVFTPTTASQFSLVGTSVQGCTSTAVSIVLTNSLPAVAINPSSATICATSNVSLSATGAVSYTWNTGVNTNSISVNPSVTTVYTVSGTDAVNGCIGSKTVSVKANPLPLVVITPSSAAICNGASINFTATGANSYVWSDGSFGNVLPLTPTANASYTITGTDSLGCVSQKTVSLVVNPLPTVAVTPVTSTICAGEVATFNASGATSYTWLPGNTNATSYTASPMVSSFYTLTGTDANNCSNKLTFILTVNACTGIDQQSADNGIVTLYPNPSNGQFTVKFEMEGDKTVVLYNSVGQVISSSSTSDSSKEFNLNGCAKGIYFVMVKTKNHSGNYKLIIE